MDLEEREAGAEQHRHDIDVNLVDQPGTQQLLDNIGAANHLNGPVAGGGSRLRDR